MNINLKASKVRDIFFPEESKKVSHMINEERKDFNCQSNNTEISFTITKLLNSTEVLEANRDKFYIIHSIGKPDYYDVHDEFDKLDKSIQRLSAIENIFNINETFTIRNGDIDTIFFYELYGKRLYSIKANVLITFGYSLLSNCFIINVMKDGKPYSIVINLVKRCFAVFKEIKKELIIKKIVNHFSDSKIEEDEINEDLKIEESEEIIKYDKDISIIFPAFFSLEKEPSASLSLLSIDENNEKKLLLSVSIKDSIFEFESVADLVKYMDETFYEPIKSRVIVLDEKNNR